MAFDIEDLVREFEQEFILKPRQQAILESRLEAESTLLRRQVERRFGPLPPEAEERIQRATEADIEEWSLRVLDARTLEDMFA